MPTSLTSGDARLGDAARKMAQAGIGSGGWRTIGSPNRASFILGRQHASPSLTRGGSRMRESRSYGSVRGALSNGRPYRDLASLLAMTWLPLNATPRSRGALRPRFAESIRPKEEGAGNAGCLLHPRSRVQKCTRKRTRAYRYSRSIPAFPAQWFYGLCRALPGDEFVLPPSLAD